MNFAMKRLIRMAFLLTCLVCLSLPCAAPSLAQDAPTRWYKGNTHMHSFECDGNDFPEMALDWYKQHGYHFASLTRHYRAPEPEQPGEVWVKQSAMDAVMNAPGVDVVARYRARFGDDWVLTRQSPPDSEGNTELEVRLRTLEEYRGLLEVPGEFLLIRGEEITERYFAQPMTASYRGSLIHTSALNIKAMVPTQGGDSVTDMIRRHLRAVREHEQQVGRPMLAHVNHPNLYRSITAADLAQVHEIEFVEVFNGQPHYRGMERVWDVANTMRLGLFKTPPIFAVATDDTHKYHNDGSSPPGRGWIMVRAAELTPEALILAMRRGDFYASSGVTLRDIRYDTAARTVTIDIEPVPGETYTTEFRGTRTRPDADARPFDADQRYHDSNDGVLATQTGTTVSYQLTGDELYVRAVVYSNRPPDVPAYDEQVKQAWTQPVGWSRHVEHVGPSRLSDPLR